MAQEIQRTETRKGAKGKLPGGVVLKPPVTPEDLKTDTEMDPDGNEEFVALIRALRDESSRTVGL